MNIELPDRGSPQSVDHSWYPRSLLIHLGSLPLWMIGNPQEQETRGQHHSY